MSEIFGQVRTLKTLSLWQPWASLIAAGVKQDETRHWFTPWRGPLAIHASKRLDLAGAPDALCDAALGLGWRHGGLPSGAIVAVAELADVLPADLVAATGRLTRANLAAGNFAPGRFAWRLANVRALRRPIPGVGRQGLFNWTPPADLHDRLGPALDHVLLSEMIGWGLTREAVHG